MIYGYPREASVAPGEDLVLHVSTDAPQFRVELHRYGLRPLRVARSGWLDGAVCPEHLPYQDWGEPGVGLRGEELPGWPAHIVPIPRDCPSGVYVALLVEGDGRGRPTSRPDPATPDGRDGRALVVVRSAAPGVAASILYKLPLLTYHAYNQVSPAPYDVAAQRGGWCLYSVPRRADLPIAVPPAVSVRRPGGGTGGTPFDVFNFDPFDPTPRQTFVHWDARALAWLEAQGYRVELCTDLDLHREGGLDLLRRYRLLLSVGHDEYWSDSMRDAAEEFVRGGGNVAFLGGNTCWWRIAFDDEHSFRRLHWWSAAPVPDRPENALTGVSFRNGGERDLDLHPRPVGFRVQHADHWVYAGTGLRDGDTFGDGPDEYVVGYECDGAHFDRRGLGRGRPVRPSGEDGTPPDFTILGIGDVEPSGWGLGNRAATMGLHAANGTVFTAATTDWTRLLERPATRVARITRNVVDALA